LFQRACSERRGHYSKTPDQPSGFDLDKPFDLPAAIRLSELQRGSVSSCNKHPARRTRTTHNQAFLRDVFKPQQVVPSALSNLRGSGGLQFTNPSTIAAMPTMTTRDPHRAHRADLREGRIGHAPDAAHARTGCSVNCRPDLRSDSGGIRARRGMPDRRRSSKIFRAGADLWPHVLRAGATKVDLRRVLSSGGAGVAQAAARERSKGAPSSWTIACAGASRPPFNHQRPA
jgi:hypothetical protein